MAAAQAAGQVVAQGVGAYADQKRDDAAAAYNDAYKRGDSEGMAAAAADYNNWKEGGDSRAELHAAGGALIGGLGGGGAFSTIGGAAGAGLASKMAGTLNDISKGIASATGSDLIGNLAANIAAGVGGAALGGTAGAAMGSNVHLYNQTVDDERALTGDPGKKSPTLFSLAMQGIVNGLNAILGTGGGGPPAASPGVVLVNGAGQALAGSISSSLTVAGYVPTNATFSSGSGDGQSSANNGNTNDLESAANQPFKDGQAITSAGRAVTKHPEYFGFDSTQDLRQVYRSDAQLNEVAANAVRDILQNGTKTTGAGGRYPDGWVTYTLPDGRAASGEFIGFRGLQK